MHTLLALATSVATGQSLINGSLDAEPQEDVPNVVVPYVLAWSFGTPEAFVDLASEELAIHCVEGLLEPSEDGGTFAHATAWASPGQPPVGRVLSTAVGDLIPGVRYRVRFESSAVQLYGRSHGAWEVTFGDTTHRADTVPLPKADPGQSEWIVQVLDGFEVDTEAAELVFRAVSDGDGATVGAALPNPPGCDYLSDPYAAELLLDGVVVYADADDDGIYADDDCPNLPSGGDQSLDEDGDGIPDTVEWASGTDPCNDDTDGDGLTNDEERNPTHRLELDVCPTSTTPTLPDLVPDSDVDEPDSDFDGLDDLEEAAAGTDPRLADSDRDGTTDAVEVDTPGRDPTACDASPLPRDAKDVLDDVIVGCACTSAAGPGPGTLGWALGLCLLAAARRR